MNAEHEQREVSRTVRQRSLDRDNVFRCLNWLNGGTAPAPAGGKGRCSVPASFGGGHGQPFSW